MGAQLLRLKLELEVGLGGEDGQDSRTEVEHGKIDRLPRLDVFTPTQSECRKALPEWPRIILQSIQQFRLAEPDAGARFEFQRDRMKADILERMLLGPIPRFLHCSAHALGENGPVAGTAVVV